MTTTTDDMDHRTDVDPSYWVGYRRGTPHLVRTTAPPNGYMTTLCGKRFHARDLDRLQGDPTASCICAHCGRTSQRED